MLTKAFAQKTPRISPQVAFVAENAVVIGDVTLAEGASVWYGAVLRGDTGSITVGKNTNIQDNAVLHTGDTCPVVVGDCVTIGHCALVHGCTVGDHCLIGMHATILNGAVIGEGSVIAAGALVTEHTVIPPHSIVMGVPGKVHGTVEPAMAEKNARNNAGYVLTARAHQAEPALPPKH